MNRAIAVSRSLGVPALVRFLPSEGWTAKFGADAYSMPIQTALTLLEAGSYERARAVLDELRTTFVADDNRGAMAAVKSKLEDSAAKHPTRREMALELANSSA